MATIILETNEVISIRHGDGVIIELVITPSIFKGEYDLLVSKPNSSYALTSGGGTDEKIKRLKVGFGVGGA